MQLQYSVSISTIGMEIKMKIHSHINLITEMTLHASSYMSYVCVNSPSKPGNIIPHVCVLSFHNINSWDTIWSIIPPCLCRVSFFFFMFQCEIFISLPWKLLMNIININNIFPNITQFSNMCLCYRKASLQKKRNWMMMRIGEIHSISLNVALSMNMTIEQWLRICELLFKSLCTFMTLKFTK